MTYSIVARDPETGQMGVAVQTALPGVGRLCPWAEAGIGAVATQALVRVGHGPGGLTLMRNGHTAKEALAAVLAGDEGRDTRQIGMVDVNGVVESFTGANCIRYAGHHIGENYAVQANMMANDTVPGAMSEAFESTDGPLVVRMVAALLAAQAEGGDFRGQQSAALKIVSGDLHKNNWDGVIYDVRVDDHATPVEELARICNRHLAGHLINEGFELIQAGDVDAAMTKYHDAAALDPDELQYRFSFALNMGVQHGRMDLVGDILRDYFKHEMWREYFHRLADARLMGMDEARATVEALMED